MTTTVQAKDLRLGDVGRTVRSQVYRNKNKTSKPKTGYYIDKDGTQHFIRHYLYVLDSMYVHENGNIVINGGEHYLHMDTEIEFIEGSEDIND